jgi:hypothetical protein
MKLDNLKNNKETISVVLLGVSVLLGVLILVKVTGFFVATARAERLVTEALAQSKPDPNKTEKYFAKSKEIADELKKKNLFAPPPPKPKQPIREVDIMGDSVLVNGKLPWRRVGDKVGDATILAIEPTQIRFEWQGRKIAMGPFGTKSSSDSGPRKRRKPDDEGRKEIRADRRERGERRGMPGRGGRRGRGGFRNLSAEERAELREKMRNMSREERREYMTKMREGADDR